MIVVRSVDSYQNASFWVRADGGHSLLAAPLPRPEACARSGPSVLSAQCSSKSPMHSRRFFNRLPVLLEQVIINRAAKIADLSQRQGLV